MSRPKKKATKAAPSRSASEVMREAMAPKPGDSAEAIADAKAAAEAMHKECPPPIWKGTKWVCMNHPRPVTVHVPRDSPPPGVRMVGARVPTTPVAMGRGHMPAPPVSQASRIGPQFTELQAQFAKLQGEHTKLLEERDGDGDGEALDALEAKLSDAEATIAGLEVGFADRDDEIGKLEVLLADAATARQKEEANNANGMAEVVLMVEEAQDLAELKSQLAALAGKEDSAAADDE